MKQLFLGIVVWMTTAFIVTPAFAQAPGTAEAAYEQGKAALKAGDTAGAIGAFKAGLGLAGDDEGRRWQLILALGLSYDRAGEPAFAIESYQRFLDQTKAHGDVLSPKWRNRREMVRGDIKTLEKRVAATHGYVTVVTEPAGAAVFVGEGRAGAHEDATSPAGFYLPVGEHVISVTLDGHERAESTITVGAGGMTPLRFTLVTPPPIVPEVTPPAEAASPVSANLSVAAEGFEPPVQVGPWIVIGSAGALAIAAGVSAGLVSAAHSDRDAYLAEHADVPETGDEMAVVQEGLTGYDEEVNRYTLATSALTGVATVTLVCGLIWMFMHGDDVYADTPTTIGLVPTAGGVAGHATWTF